MHACRSTLEDPTISWTRLLDGRFTDALVGRDLLVGCAIGTGIAVAVALHVLAPSWLGAAPGRPDNVGYVETQLASLIGLRQELAELLGLFRSNLVLVMGFVVILVMARIALRRSWAAMLAAFLIFVPNALPKGELLALDLAFAVAVSLTLLLVLMRLGLLAAVVSMLAYVALQAAPLGMGLGSWPTSRTVLVLAVVAGTGVYGFARSLGGRPALRDVLAEG